MPTLTLEFQADPRLSKNSISRANWRDTMRHKSNARDTAAIIGLNEVNRGWQTPKTCNVEVRQYWCGKPFDWDGLATLTGPIIDGLVDAGVLPEDDSPNHILQYSMSAERVAKRPDSRISVTIIPVSK